MSAVELGITQSHDGTGGGSNLTGKNLLEELLRRGLKPTDISTGAASDQSIPEEEPQTPISEDGLSGKSLFDKLKARGLKPINTPANIVDVQKVRADIREAQKN